MVIPTGLDNNARCHILDPLQLIKQFIRNTIQKAIPIIKSRYYEGVNQEFSRMLRQAIPDRANTYIYMARGHLGYCIGLGNNIS